MLLDACCEKVAHDVAAQGLICDAVLTVQCSCILLTVFFSLQAMCQQNRERRAYHGYWSSTWSWRTVSNDSNRLAASFSEFVHRNGRNHEWCARLVESACLVTMNFDRIIIFLMYILIINL